MTTSMPPSGTGAGGTIGGPPTPLPRELEASAWAIAARASLGIVKDSIDQSFTMTNPRYNFGYLGGFGYKSTAGQPLLDHPLESTRMAQASMQGEQLNWQPMYDQLIAKLPEELQSRLMEELQKPLNQRDAAFIILNETMVQSARFLTAFNILSQPVDPASLEAARTELNLLLPFAALRGSVINGSDYGSLVFSWAEEEGANHVDADGVLHALIELQVALRAMRDIQESIKTNEENRIEFAEREKEAAEAAARKLETLKYELQKMAGNDLQSLLPMVNAISLVADSLSLPVTESAGLFLGLSIASIGIGTDESSTGIIGPSMKTAIDNMVNQILPDGNDASKRFLSSLLIVGAIVSAGSAESINSSFGTTAPSSFSFGNLFALAMSSLASASFGFEENGLLLNLLSTSLLLGVGWLSYLTSDIDPRIEPIRSFTFSIFLTLLAASGLVNTFCKEALAICGAKEKTQNSGSELLAQCLHLFLILAFTRQGRQKPEELMEEFASYLTAGTEAAQTLLTENTKEASPIAAISLSQVQSALEEKNFASLLECLNWLLENKETSLTGLLKDIDKLNLSSMELLKSLSTYNKEQPMTGVINVV